jgi:hypothetical protein
LEQPRERGHIAAKGRQLLDIFPECSGFKMLVGDRFLFKALDMYESAFVVVVSIALAPHSTRAVFIQPVKIMIDDFLCGFLPALWNREGHNIPYHNAYSFWFSTAGITMAAIHTEMLLPKWQQADLMMNGIAGYKKTARNSISSLRFLN